jgi:two-component sensor histidine kinase
MLTVRDDGPGLKAADGRRDQRLGLRIMRGLADELRGSLSVTPGEGAEIIVEFPIGP